MTPSLRRQRFEGEIAGVGSRSGTRVVVGHWHRTPMGAFSDVMVETTAGHRVLLAPRADVAAFIEATYVFDEVRIEPVRVTEHGSEWQVSTPSLDLCLRTGRSTILGHLLRRLPRRLLTSPAWCLLADPMARVLLRGVRTRGTARAGRREYYGATDLRAVSALTGTFDGDDLGPLRPVDPPCRFGFSSTPRRPSVTTVVTTVTGGPGPEPLSRAPCPRSGSSAPGTPP
jgi:hypothetical protein